VLDIHFCLQPPLSNPPRFSLSEPCCSVCRYSYLSFQIVSVELVDGMVVGMIWTDPIVADFSTCLEKLNEPIHLFK